MKGFSKKIAYLAAGGLLLFGASGLVPSHPQTNGNVADLFIENAYATVDSICDCSSNKSLVCHVHQEKHGGGKDKDTGDDMHTISVGEPAVPAHIAHGDTLGPCPGDTEYDVEAHTDRPCVCADGTVGNLVDDPPENMKVVRQVQGG